MITPDQAQGPNGQDLKTLEEYEALIDHELQSKWDGVGEWAWAPPVAYLNRKVMKLLKERYEAAGWAIRYHIATEQRDNDVMYFRPAKVKANGSSRQCNSLG